MLPVSNLCSVSPMWPSPSALPHTCILPMRCALNLSANRIKFYLRRPFQQNLSCSAVVNVYVQARTHLDHVQYPVFRLLLPSPRHPSRPDVLQVLQPLEIAHCDSTGVQQNVWEEDYSLLKKYVLCSHCGWAYLVIASLPFAPSAISLQLKR